MCMSFRGIDAQRFNDWKKIFSGKQIENTATEESSESSRHRSSDPTRKGQKDKPVPAETKDSSSADTRCQLTKCDVGLLTMIACNNSSELFK